MNKGESVAPSAADSLLCARGIHAGTRSQSWHPTPAEKEAAAVGGLTRRFGDRLMAPLTVRRRRDSAPLPLNCQARFQACQRSTSEGAAGEDCARPVRVYFEVLFEPTVDMVPVVVTEMVSFL